MMMFHQVRLIGCEVENEIEIKTIVFVELSIEIILLINFNRYVKYSLERR